ncbi:MAG: hypothetical protein WAT92_21100, partial [Saprospiraceae bacterium]
VWDNDLHMRLASRKQPIAHVWLFHTFTFSNILSLHLFFTPQQKVSVFGSLVSATFHSQSRRVKYDRA